MQKSLAGPGEWREIPGPKGTEWHKRMERVSARSVQNDDGLILDSTAKFHGVFIYDVDGNCYIDFFSGAGVSNFGHGNEELIAGPIRQIESGAWQYDASVIPHTQGIILAERFLGRMPGDMPHGGKVFFCSSGTEAVEALLKAFFVARQPRSRIIAFEGAFHGRTLGSLAINASQEIHTRDFPAPFRVHHFPFPRARGALDDLFYQAGTGALPVGDIAAIIMEPVQGEGGIHVPDKRELARLEAWREKHGIPLIVDEVQSGFGRTGRFLACERFGLEPDGIALAKAMPAGIAPCGAAILGAGYDFPQKGMHANTNGGNYVATAAALEVLDYFDEHPEFLKNVSYMGDYLWSRLNTLALVFNNFSKHHDAAPYLSVPRGVGLMRGIDVLVPGETTPYSVDYAKPSGWGERDEAIPVDRGASAAKRNRIVSACWRLGLLVEGAGPYGIRFMPPLTVNREEMDKALHIFEKALESVYGVKLAHEQ